MSAPSVVPPHRADSAHTSSTPPGPRASRRSARSVFTILATVAGVATVAYGATPLLTRLLDGYLFRAPYAIPALDAPFAIVAIGVGYLCLERHRLRNDFQSAALGNMLWLAALLTVAHILG